MNEFSKSTMSLLSDTAAPRFPGDQRENGPHHTAGNRQGWKQVAVKTGNNRINIIHIMFLKL